jgi:cytochrome c2
MWMVSLIAAVAAVSGCMSAAPADGVQAGEKVYAELKCRLCHSIGGQGNRRNPLDGVGSRLDEESIRTWIIAPQEMDPKVKKKSYGDLPAEQLEALVSYLQSLKNAE